MAEKKVVIVGAGNAGLSAAYQLYKAGIDFVVLDAADTFGGRVSYKQSGDIIYNDGAAFTEPQWETTFQYLEEFGLTDRIFDFSTKVYGLPKDDGSITYFTDRGSLFDAALQVKGLPKGLITQGMRFLPAFLKAQRLVGENHDFSKLTEVSKLTTREWAEAHGGPEIANRLLGPMLGTMTLARSCDVSAAHPIALMKLMKGMKGLVGGLKIINEAIYEKIKDNVRLNTPVQEIVIEDGEVKGVRLADGQIIDADQVICATDATDALTLMPGVPEVYKEALGTCTYCKTWHYVYCIPEKILPDGFLALLVPESDDSLITTIFGGPLGPGDQVPGSTAVHDFGGGAQMFHTFTAGWHDDKLMSLSDDERNALVAREIGRYYPGFEDKCELIACNRMERAINLEPPGQFEAIEDLKNNHLSDVKGLYLGGEYMFLIACTEGAWMTGKQAAQKLIAES